MKSIYGLVIVSLLSGILLLFSSKWVDPIVSDASNSVHVYNWGEYIDPDLLVEFEEETGIKVIYETFDSNEAMLVKVNQGGTSYDVIMPSEYMVEKMVNEDLLVQLDHDKLPNLKNIEETYLNQPFDPGNMYSIPYFFGTVGVLYNPERTGNLDFSDWDTLWDEELHNDLLLVDGAREVMGFSLNSLGYSLNTKEMNELNAATEKLIELAPNVRGVVGDEISQMMEIDEAKAAVVWSGMAQDVMWENEVLDYVVPEDGSNLWFDTMAIPQTSNNIEGAHAFINFMLDKEVAAQNTEYVGYSTPNKEAYSLLDEEVQNDTRFYPTDELKDDLEVYENLGTEYIGIYNEKFLKFKMNLNQ